MRGTPAPGAAQWAAKLATVSQLREGGSAESEPSNVRKADAERKPSLLLPDRPLSGLPPSLVNVIVETIERIREQDDSDLLMEHNALAPEIAGTLPASSLASSTCMATH
jgi:hypothetical protein